MFESIRMPAKSVSRMSLCGLAVAVWALIGGFHPGNASAACSGTIEGQGSLLQKIPQQEIWTTGYVGGGCSGGKAEPKYTSSESSTGLLAWGFLSAIERKWAFIGTDVGPSAAQIANAKAAAGAGSHVIVVPVAQTAIAVMVHPPANCAFAVEEGITNAHLEEAFSGKAETWAAIGAKGTGCSGSLTRVVRKDDSGTTYQFKNYLAQINTLIHTTEAAPCAGQKKWSELEAFGYSETPNTEWPECGTIGVERPIGTGGGEEAKKVAETAGTIGYATLPDAKAKGAGTVEVQNNGISGPPLYVTPNKGTEEARCGEAEYTVPAEANTALSGTGVDVDWSQVFGGNPSAGGTVYPLCALTYDLAWQNYETAGFAATVGTDVKHYDEYIVEHGIGTNKKWYANLPAKTGSSEEHNVKMAAEYAIGKISASATCSGTIEGQGSSLQKIPQQEIWTTGWNSSGCAVGTHAEAKYTSSESPTGLLAWGFLGTIERKWAYIGTDDGPSAAQIANAKAAAGAGSHVIVVPVAQTAIAVMVHPPVECSLKEITNAHLEEAFSGTAETWSAIGGEGTGCGKSLTRVVRKDASGTTYQFKNYLAQVNQLRNSPSGEMAVCPGQKKWSELEEVPTKNLEWPECGSIAVERPVGTGGGEVASTVVANAGRIGYATLPDAKAKGATTVKVQNNGTSGSPTYAGPNAGTEEARCSEAEYTVPAGANTALSGTGVDVDWSLVFGGSPKIGATVYPICMLTYDLAWQNYETAGFGAGETVGASVKAYYEYIVKEGTGAMTVKKWYSNLPAKTGSSEEHNVKMAAEFSLGKIVK